MKRRSAVGRKTPGKGSADRAANRRNRTVQWAIWKIFIPFTILVLFWPIYGIVLGLQQPFERAFSHGDLLIFSALILIESALEGDRVLRPSSLFYSVCQLARGFAVLLFFIFGFMRYDVMQNEATFLAKGASASMSNKFELYCFFNLCVAVVSILFSMAAFWKSENILVREELASFGIEKAK